MKKADILAQFADHDRGDEPISVLVASLAKIAVDEFPEGIEVQPVASISGNTQVIEWDGVLLKKKGVIYAEARQLVTRKYWNLPLNAEHFIDIVRRSVETRSRHEKDVEFINFDDDGAFLNLEYRIATHAKNLGDAYAIAQKVTEQLEAPAHAASEKAGQAAADIAGKVSGFSTGELGKLFHVVDAAATTDEKGRSLEELVCRLFQTIPGFSISDRIRTATEEIDISILNASQEPIWDKEKTLILAECKNWSGKAGKNEVVLFRSKIENRRNRSSFGVLVSWNGFAGTVEKELLRGSHESPLIALLTRDDIKKAISTGDFNSVLQQGWNKAVNS